MALLKRVFAATLALWGGVAFGGPLDAAWLVGRTDRSPLSYRVGEKMTFSLELHGAGRLARGRYFIDWQREGDDGKSFRTARTRPRTVRCPSRATSSGVIRRGFPSDGAAKGSLGAGLRTRIASRESAVSTDPRKRRRPELLAVQMPVTAIWALSR